MSRLFLIRHGETAGNALRIVQRPDVPLSPRGVAQAERLARRLAGQDVVRIVASDYARAVATAEAAGDEQRVSAGTHVAFANGFGYTR